MPSDVQNGSLRTPIQLGDSGPLEDINRRIRANREEQDNYLTVLINKASKSQNDEKKKNPDLSTEEMMLEEKMRDFKHEMAKRKRMLDDNAAKQKKDDNEERDKLERESKGEPDATNTENDPNLEGFDYKLMHACGDCAKFIIDPEPGSRKTFCGFVTYYIFTVWIKLLIKVFERVIEEYQTKRILLEQAARATMELTASKKVVTDDGLSALSADQYVRIRLLPMAASYSQKAPGLASYAHLSAIVGVVLSVTSSALATFNASVFIPALLAFSGAVTAWTNYQQIDLRLLQTNAAVNKLNQVGAHTFFSCAEPRTRHLHLHLH